MSTTTTASKYRSTGPRAAYAVVAASQWKWDLTRDRPWQPFSPWWIERQLARVGVRSVRVGDAPGSIAQTRAELIKLADLDGCGARVGVVCVAPCDDSATAIAFGYAEAAGLPLDLYWPPDVTRPPAPRGVNDHQAVRMTIERGGGVTVCPPLHGIGDAERVQQGLARLEALGRRIAQRDRRRDDEDTAGDDGGGA